MPLPCSKSGRSAGSWWNAERPMRKALMEAFKDLDYACAVAYRAWCFKRNCWISHPTCLFLLGLFLGAWITWRSSYRFRRRILLNRRRMRTPPLFLTPISPYVWSSSHFVNVDPHPRRPGPNSAMTHPVDNYLADSIKRFLSVLTLSTFVFVRNWSLRIVVRCRL